MIKFLAEACVEQLWVVWELGAVIVLVHFAGRTNLFALSSFS